MELAHREIVSEQGVEAVLLDVGENHVELLAPLGPDTPVGKFIARQGPGLHHVAYQVADIDATLEALKRAGLQLIDEQPRIGIRGSRVAFMHPRASAGVLTGDRRAGRRRGGALMTSGARRVSIGFHGGQVLALRVADEDLKALNKALGDGGWHEIPSEDGPVRVALSEIVYVSADSDEPKVGFG